MASSPSFASVPKVVSVSFNTANSNRDGSGTIQTGFTAGSSGSMITRITISAAGPTSSGMVRLFHFDGTNNFLMKEIPVDNITPSSSVEAFRAQVLFNPPIFIPSGHAINLSTEVSNSFVAVIEGGDL